MYINLKLKTLPGSLKHFIRKHIPALNRYENKALTVEFQSVTRAIKENNSRTVFEFYYVPKAITEILKEEGYLTTFNGAVPRAKAMLLADLANGVLDEFYRFK